MNVRLQGLTVILASVLIGLAAGVVVERSRTERRPQPQFGQGPFRSEGERGNQPRPRLPPGFDRLDLTESQQHQIDSVFRSWQPRTDSVMDSLMPRLRALRDSAMSDVNQILTEEQRKTLSEITQMRTRQPPPGNRTPERRRR